MKLKDKILRKMMQIWIFYQAKFPKASKVIVHSFFSLVNFCFIYCSYRYWMVRSILLFQKKQLLPVKKKAIMMLSSQYQKEWRFRKELELMQHALILYPNWSYALKRMEWHNRRTFHKDPQKSKVQPRKMLRLPYIKDSKPKQSTLDNLCIVTGASSNGPYFELCVQLIESLKATRRYNKVAIKIIDAGLTEDHKAFLISKFNVEIKDTGWDVDPKDIRLHSSFNEFLFNNVVPKNSWKAVTSRPYIHKHFPGYKYYFWFDADTWVQDERGVDQLVCFCEKYGLSATRDYTFEWTKNFDNFGGSSIPEDFGITMVGKPALINSIYCIREDICKKLAKYSDEAIQKKGFYTWGFDMAILNYVFYKEVDVVIPNDDYLHWHYLNMILLGARIDQSKALYTDKDILISVLALNGGFKTLPYCMLFANGSRFENIQAFKLSQHLNKKDPIFAEEMAYQYKKRYGWQHGSYFYRTYPSYV